MNNEDRMIDHLYRIAKALEAIAERLGEMSNTPDAAMASGRIERDARNPA